MRSSRLWSRRYWRDIAEPLRGRTFPIELAAEELRFVLGEVWQAERDGNLAFAVEPPR